MLQHQTIIAIVSIVPLAACASLSPKDVSDPSTITISQALQEIGKGFAAMSTELQGRKLGFYPCSALITFNVTANANDGGKLVLDLSASPAAGYEKALVNFGAKANVEQTAAASGTRGNVISIAMYNPGCIPKDTLAHDNPELVGEAAAGMSRGLPDDGPPLDLPVPTANVKPSS